MLALFLLLTWNSLSAQTDSLYLSIDSSSVVFRRPDLKAIGNLSNGLKWDLSQGSGLPGLFGSDNPIRNAMLLPGIQTNMDLDSGLHIYGCDSMHSEISINGVPVYGVGRLFGLFSPFNTDHFGSMRLQSTADGSNRIGGVLRLDNKTTLPQTISGIVNLGLMSLQTSISAPIGKKSALTVSARKSLLEEIYGKKIKLEDMPVQYGFHDVNISFLSRPTSSDEILLDAFASSDHYSMNNGYFLDGDMHLTWRNGYAALHWNHIFNETKLEQTIYHTQYTNFGDLNMLGMNMVLPSSIQTDAYRTTYKRSELIAYLDVAHHKADVQVPVVTGGYHTFSMEDDSPEKRQMSLESTLSAKWKHYLTFNWTVTPKLDIQSYKAAGEKLKIGISPALTISYNPDNKSNLSVSYALKRQYLFQSGISDIGLPLEFWFLAGKDNKPQYSHNLNLSYDKSLAHGGWSLSTNLYYRSLHHQIEYFGSFLELLNIDYAPMDRMYHGNGINYGVNGRLSKEQGKFTCWMSYSLGRSLRRFNAISNKVFPANHERIHELDAYANYQIDKWSFSSSLSKYRYNCIAEHHGSC